MIVLFSIPLPFFCCLFSLFFFYFLLRSPFVCFLLSMLVFSSSFCSNNLLTRSYGHPSLSFFADILPLVFSGYLRILAFDVLSLVANLTGAVARMRPTTSTVAKMRLSKKGYFIFPTLGTNFFQFNLQQNLKCSSKYISSSTFANCDLLFKFFFNKISLHLARSPKCAPALQQQVARYSQNAAVQNNVLQQMSNGNVARSPKCGRLFKQVARSPKCPQPHFLQAKLLGRVILLNNFGSFIEGEKDRLRCVSALSRVLVHLNVRCGRCHRQSQARMVPGASAVFQDIDMRLKIFSTILG